MKNRLNDWTCQVGESVLMGCLEPNSLRFTRQDEVTIPRVSSAINRSRNEKLARFRYPINRNAFLLGCLAYTMNKAEEHLIIGYGLRYGSTTKIESLHHAPGKTGSVHLSNTIAHTMWQYYQQDNKNDLLVFHNHPLNPLNLLADNFPLVSNADRIFIETRAMNVQQLIQQISDGGRILFYLGENGFVKQFSLPRLSFILSRLSIAT